MVSSEIRRRLPAMFVAALLLILIAPAGSRAASDLQLAPDLSFNDDSSSNFPIVVGDPTDAGISGDRPTVIFFGTAHCWNTAREAERVVKLFPKYRGQVHFVVVDLNNVTPAQQPLVARYYHGYIPTLAIFNGKGQSTYDQAGETSATRGDTAALDELIGTAAGGASSTR